MDTAAAIRSTLQRYAAAGRPVKRDFHWIADGDAYRLTLPNLAAPDQPRLNVATVTLDRDYKSAQRWRTQLACRLTHREPGSRHHWRRSAIKRAEQEIKDHIADLRSDADARAKDHRKMDTYLDQLNRKRQEQRQ